MYEMSVIGLALPSQAIVKPFIGNLFETSREKGLRATEFFRFFLSFYILGVLVIWRIVQLKSLNKIFTIEMILQLGTDLTIFAFVITIFALCIILSDKTTQELLDSTEYIDFVMKGYYFHLIFILEGFLFLIMMLKMLYIFSIHKGMKIATISFGLAVRQLLAYSVLVFPVLC
jgi:uncharacterized membrane protein